MNPPSLSRPLSGPGADEHDPRSEYIVEMGFENPGEINQATDNIREAMRRLPNLRRFAFHYQTVRVANSELFQDPYPPRNVGVLFARRILPTIFGPDVAVKVILSYRRPVVRDEPEDEDEE
jgi:hypothetical protein